MHWPERPSKLALETSNMSLRFRDKISHDMKLRDFDDRIMKRCKKVRTNVAQTFRATHNVAKTSKQRCKSTPAAKQRRKQRVINRPENPEVLFMALLKFRGDIVF